MESLLFEKMVSLSHLFECWDHFRKGKRKRKDIQCFERHLEDNVFELHEQLITDHYTHDPYHFFYVFDPKERYIGKASVKDRLVHHMVHATLSPIFDKRFIFHSLSSRQEKGIHLGMVHIERMIYQVSESGSKPCYALKMDIRRFFDNIHHGILKRLIRKQVQDTRVLNIVDAIIDSCYSSEGATGKVGLPLGNVTSQLFANIYLHELDDFVKRVLRVPCYLRYCDDFIFLSCDNSLLETLVPIIRGFLQDHLLLQLHPKKILLRKLSQGIDFVGYLFFEKHKLVRTRTKRRMKRRLSEAHISYLRGRMEADSLDARLQSYLGILSHANQHTLAQALINAYGVRRTV